MQITDKYEIIKSIIEEHQFRIFPLRSVDEFNKCSCGNIKCCSIAKHPILKGNWKKYATSDIKIIDSWIEKYKNPNIGFVTGEYSMKTKKYLVVIDVDSSEHEIIKTLPKTFYYKTGSNGFHFWYWSDKILRNSVSLIDDKVDVRGKNGYVILPPSKNKNGSYEFLNDSYGDIVDLPEYLFNEIIEKQKKIKEISKLKKSTKLSELKKPEKSQEFLFWSKNSVNDLRNKIFVENKQIPKGVRNMCLHRLLSSDRAKGSDYNNLFIKAKEYHEKMEESESFNDEEIKLVVNSVSRYPIYNLDYNKVNEIFISWAEKNKTKNYKQYDFDSLDKEYFELYEKSNKHILTIPLLQTHRENWYKEKNILIYPKYKTQLLAKKLENYGYTKKKTKKNNLWNLVLKY